MEDVAHPTVALHVKDHNLVFVVVSMVAGGRYEQFHVHLRSYPIKQYHFFIIQWSRILFKLVALFQLCDRNLRSEHINVFADFNCFTPLPFFFFFSANFFYSKLFFLFICCSSQQYPSYQQPP
ncbi:uncharacterized protein LTHEOB_4954 [Lasiodiplodia theobromae]|uniref:uncharacterized protein n=1 Tax=Lasiodiplodia theobromae TaxID=45133 RepID=UPI0015C3645C|nr:uncharacterized protein LTHEOB_4954 [Lasiodiplodia theobromae]KAF4545695.1 hypothetical protein LTHEOB_4954 [Lasiodiplodia theobromae]